MDHQFRYYVVLYGILYCAIRQGAKLASRTAICYGAANVVTLAVAILLARDVIWRIYTDDPGLGAVMANLFFILAFYIVPFPFKRPHLCKLVQT